jgi:hypothetical protein
MMRIASGNASKTSNALRRNRKIARMRGNREGRARTRRDARLAARTGVLTVRVCGIAVSHHYAPAREEPQTTRTAPVGAYSPRISRRRRFRAVIRSFIFSDSTEPRVFFLDGAGVDGAGFIT